MEILIIGLVLMGFHFFVCVWISQSSIGGAYRRQVMATIATLAVIGGICLPLVVLYGLGFVLFMHFMVCAILVSFFGMLVSAVLCRRGERRKMPWIASYLSISLAANFWPLLGHVEPWHMDMMLSALSVLSVVVGALGIAAGLMSREFWMAECPPHEKRRPRLVLN